MSAYVTTSWDDGGAFDLRLAERLREHGVSGTFYWTVDAERFVMPGASEAEEILALGMEIGSHTMTHPDVTAIEADVLQWELEESKKQLEALTGREVSSFCYPFGHFNDRAGAAVASAGYRLARTAVGFRNDLGSDPFQMPVTIHVYPHGRRVHASHALKEKNIIGLARWLTSYKAGTDLVALTEAALDELENKGGILHLWGHSWELEELGLWDTLDELLQMVSDRPGITHVTNAELMAMDSTS
jgi:peptidoglycan/xylan/chitin deacetylase (PgdA/CDA1 family)